MSFGSRLKDRREELGLKQSELGKLLGVTGSAIGNYENEVSSPKADILYQIFNVLKCDANYLFQDEMKDLETDDITVPEIKMIKKYRNLDTYGKNTVSAVLDMEFARCTEKINSQQPTIQILRSIYKASAGCGFELDNQDQWEKIEIPDTPEARKADFAITITGNSMEPIYYDGQTVLVRKQPAVDIGETGIYIINGSGFIKRNGGDHLISINSQYDDIYFSESDTVQCAGKVIGVVQE